MASLAFSCLLPVYYRDRPEYLREALESICASSLAPHEIILCEDGELTASLDAEISRVSDVPIRRVRNTGPNGLHHNLNNGLRHVTTPWIARCDADDINARDRFEKQIAYLAAQPNIDVLGCDILEFDPAGNTSRKNMPTAPADVVRWCVSRNPINHMTAFIRTEALVACGGYPVVPFKEDYALWLTLLAADRTLANLPEALVQARMGENFYARRSGWKNIRSEWDIMKRKLRVKAISPILAIACFGLRAIALAAPSNIVGQIYRSLLRRPNASRA